MCATRKVIAEIFSIVIVPPRKFLRTVSQGSDANSLDTRVTKVTTLQGDYNLRVRFDTRVSRVLLSDPWYTVRSNFLRGTMTIEKISAITFLVAHMRNSVRFYRDV